MTTFIFGVGGFVTLLCIFFVVETILGLRRAERASLEEKSPES